MQSPSTERYPPRRSRPRPSRAASPQTRSHPIARAAATGPAGGQNDAAARIAPNGSTETTNRPSSENSPKRRRTTRKPKGTVTKGAKRKKTSIGPSQKRRAIEPATITHHIKTLNHAQTVDTVPKLNAGMETSLSPGSFIGLPLRRQIRTQSLGTSKQPQSSRRQVGFAGGIRRRTNTTVWGRGVPRKLPERRS